VHSFDKCSFLDAMEETPSGAAKEVSYEPPPREVGIHMDLH
jgi:hypothetical protein